mmetsp:Transcript_7405/g.9684  ORF Transcript_7405/g.9684 Transcript_7405/m.9684 type:complete len:659 (-) Transcript_7405:309-2285(-)
MQLQDLVEHEVPPAHPPMVRRQQVRRVVRAEVAGVVRRDRRPVLGRRRSFQADGAGVEVCQREQLLAGVLLAGEEAAHKLRVAVLVLPRLLHVVTAFQAGASHEVDKLSDAEVREDLVQGDIFIAGRLHKLLVLPHELVVGLVSLLVGDPELKRIEEAGPNVPRHDQEAILGHGDALIADHLHVDFLLHAIHGLERLEPALVARVRVGPPRLLVGAVGVLVVLQAFVDLAQRQHQECRRHRFLGVGVLEDVLRLLPRVLCLVEELLALYLSLTLFLIRRPIRHHLLRAIEEHVRDGAHELSASGRLQRCRPFSDLLGLEEELLHLAIGILFLVQDGVVLEHDTHAHQQVRTHGSLDVLVVRQELVRVAEELHRALVGLVRALCVADGNLDLGLELGAQPTVALAVDRLQLLHGLPQLLLVLELAVEVGQVRHEPDSGLLVHLALCRVLLLRRLQGVLRLLLLPQVHVRVAQLVEEDRPHRVRFVRAVTDAGQQDLRLLQRPLRADQHVAPPDLAEEAAHVQQQPGLVDVVLLGLSGPLPHQRVARVRDPALQMPGHGGVDGVGAGLLVDETHDGLLVTREARLCLAHIHAGQRLPHRVHAVRLQHVRANPIQQRFLLRKRHRHVETAFLLGELHGAEELEVAPDSGDVLRLLPWRHEC